MKPFTYIFFDLDHTLWDYDRNAEKVLTDLYNEFELSKVIDWEVSAFIGTFFKTNAGLWHDYNTGKIHRDEIRQERFRRILESGGSSDQTLGQELSQYFLFHCPRQQAIMKDADLILDYLSRKYPMSIITNGFDDVQSLKLRSCGLEKYFSRVFTSETTGHKKPSREIFDHALEQVGADRTTALMIGDNPKTDILGAQNAGITPLLFNPKGTVKSDCQLQITDLADLMKLL